MIKSKIKIKNHWMTCSCFIATLATPHTSLDLGRYGREVKSYCKFAKLWINEERSPCFPERKFPCSWMGSGDERRGARDKPRQPSFASPVELRTPTGACGSVNTSACIQKGSAIDIVRGGKKNKVQSKLSLIWRSCWCETHQNIAMNSHIEPNMFIATQNVGFLVVQ